MVKTCPNHGYVASSSTGVYVDLLGNAIEFLVDLLMKKNNIEVYIVSHNENRVEFIIFKDRIKIKINCK